MNIVKSDDSFDIATIGLGSDVGEIFHDVRELNEQFSKSHTEFTRRALTMSAYGDYHKLRQVSAELQSRQDALVEATIAQKRDEIKLREIERELSASDDAARRELLEIDKLEVLYRLDSRGRRIEGASNDVRDLYRIYRQIKPAWITETQSHLMRVFAQSLRDMRECGAIRTGNQEYLEQLGVNPSWAFSECQRFLGEEYGQPEMSAGRLSQWLAEIATKCEQTANTKAENLKVTHASAD